MIAPALEPDLGLSVLSPIARLWVELHHAGVFLRVDQGRHQLVPERYRCQKCRSPHTRYRGVVLLERGFQLRCKVCGAKVFLGIPREMDGGECTFDREAVRRFGRQTAMELHRELRSRR